MGDNRAESVRAGGLVLVFVCLAFFLGNSSARQNYLPALLLLSFLAFGIVCRWPRQAFLLLISLGATVFSSRPGAFSLGGIRTDLLEALCFCLLGAWLLGIFVTGGNTRSPLAGPLIAFVTSAFLGAVVALSNGASRQDVEGPLKTFLFYLLPLALAHYFRDQAGRDVLERMIMTVAWLGGLVVLAAAVANIPLPSGGPLEQAFVEGVSGVRFREPLLALSVLALFLLCARVTRQRVSWRISAQLALQTIVVLLSYNRSTVVPVVLALLLFLWTRPGERRPLRGLTVVVSAALGLTLLFAAAGGGYLGREGSSVYARMATVLDPQVFQTSSYLDRASENESARAAIKDHPLVGVGLGRPYGAKRKVYLPNPPRIVSYQRTFIHNAYFGVWLNLGLFGILALLWLAARVASLSRSVWDRRNHPEAQRELAVGFALLAFAMQAIFAASLTSRPTILAVSASLVFLTHPRNRAQALRPDRIPLADAIVRTDIPAAHRRR